MEIAKNEKADGGTIWIPPDSTTIRKEVRQFFLGKLVGLFFLLISFLLIYTPILIVSVKTEIIENKVLFKIANSESVEISVLMGLSILFAYIGIRYLAAETLNFRTVFSRSDIFQHIGYFIGTTIIVLVIFIIAAIMSGTREEFQYNKEMYHVTDRLPENMVYASVIEGDKPTLFLRSISDKATDGFVKSSTVTFTKIDKKYLEEKGTETVPNSDRVYGLGESVFIINKDEVRLLQEVEPEK